MKIASFNINNINKRLANLIAWLRAAKPDVACLQELKAADREFPRAAIEQAGYGAVWHGEKSWNGVAILARGCEPIVTRDELPGDPDDAQARYIEAAVHGVLIASLYAPNGNPQLGPKFSLKLAWLDRLLAHAAELLAAGVPVVLAGDYNVVPTDRDIYPTRSYAKNALLRPESRARFARLLDQGWVDAVRTLHPEAVEQLAVIPDFVAACGFANASRAGFEADDFLASAVATEEGRGGIVLVASGDRTASSWPRTRPRSSTRCVPAKWYASARPKSARATVWTPRGSRTLSRCAATLRTSSPARRASARLVRRLCCASTEAWMRSSRPAGSRSKQKICGSFGRSRP